MKTTNSKQYAIYGILFLNLVMVILVCIAIRRTTPKPVDTFKTDYPELDRILSGQKND
ncbi:hypothetical protein [Chryseobacterium sp.]|uniref:hypothetical protein n=1 Tax=Chryseobacterium sp. TaxID=1871047 RepID=UPI002898F0B9|nr:hypothetical protein [Chryseobacterium sp.]